MKVIKNPGVKKEWPRIKNALLQKYDIEIGLQGLLLLKDLIIMTSLQNIVISGAQGLMLMGSKNNVLQPGRLSKILIPSTSGDLEHP